MSVLSPGVTFGRYRIMSLLGKGGMGEVYLAEDNSLDRKVALKLLPEQFVADNERLRRFVQEAKAASALNHPNIVTIYEIGQEQGLHFLATEYIDGQTLRQHMTAGRPALRDVLDIATQAAAALAAAHAAGIVHRDIKPENMMLRRDGILKVLDFGLAKLTEKTPSGDATVGSNPPQDNRDDRSAREVRRARQASYRTVNVPLSGLVSTPREFTNAIASPSVCPGFRHV